MMDALSAHNRIFNHERHEKVRNFYGLTFFRMGFHANLRSGLMNIGRIGRIRLFHFFSVFFL